FIFFSVWSGIATLPESLDEIVPLSVSTQLLESKQLLIGNDKLYLIYPVPIVLAFSFLIGFQLFGAERPVEGILILADLCLSRLFGLLAGIDCCCAHHANRKNY